jgi:hypothetical protein
MEVKGLGNVCNCRTEEFDLFVWVAINNAQLDFAVPYKSTYK